LRLRYRQTPILQKKSSPRQWRERSLINFGVLLNFGDFEALINSYAISLYLFVFYLISQIYEF
jgi:hypothetical protein